MTDPFPLVSQFRSDSPHCPSRGFNGCAVATTEAILRRYRPLDILPRQADLGESMGRRHRVWGRANGIPSTHGICPSAWCPMCSYLELKARHVPVAYGRLTIEQMRKHLRLRHAMHLGGWYAAIRQVGATSFADGGVATGRSDRSKGGEFGHSIVVWEVGRLGANGVPETYIVSDPDFGSKARPRVPRHCEFDAREIEQMYQRLNWPLAYCLSAPPPLGGVQPAPGTILRFGGELRGRGLWKATMTANQRMSPFIRDDNVAASVKPGTEFRVFQSTLAGTNVGGSTKWHGNAAGDRWMHHSVIRPVGGGG